MLAWAPDFTPESLDFWPNFHHFREFDHILSAFPAGRFIVHCRLCSLPFFLPPLFNSSATHMRSLAFNRSSLLAVTFPSAPRLLSVSLPHPAAAHNKNTEDFCPGSRRRASARSMWRRPQQSSATRRIHTNKHSQKPVLTEQHAPQISMRMVTRATKEICAASIKAPSQERL